MKIKGKIHSISATEKVTESFQKREFAVEYAENPMYPQFIGLQASQGRCEILNNIRVGEEVEVDFNLRGREWKSPTGEVKYFNTLDAWKITPVSAPSPASANPSTAAQIAQDDEDLPF